MNMEIGGKTPIFSAEDSGLVVSFAERQRLVGKPQWDALEKKYP